MCPFPPVQRRPREKREKERKRERERNGEGGTAERGGGGRVAHGAAVSSKRCTHGEERIMRGNTTPTRKNNATLLAFFPKRQRVCRVHGIFHRTNLSTTLKPPSKVDVPTRSITRTAVVRGNSRLLKTICNVDLPPAPPYWWDPMDQPLLGNWAARLDAMLSRLGRCIDSPYKPRPSQHSSRLSRLSPPTCRYSWLASPAWRKGCGSCSFCGRTRGRGNC